MTSPIFAKLSKKIAEKHSCETHIICFGDRTNLISSHWRIIDLLAQPLPCEMFLRRHWHAWLTLRYILRSLQRSIILLKVFVEHEQIADEMLHQAVWALCTFPRIEDIPCVFIFKVNLIRFHQNNSINILNTIACNERRSLAESKVLQRVWFHTRNCHKIASLILNCNAV